MGHQGKLDINKNQMTTKQYPQQSHKAKKKSKDKTRQDRATKKKFFF